MKICWRKNLKKKKKKGRISTYHVTRARKKNQILSLQQNESRESSKRPINKVSLKLHTTSFHSMNSLHPSLLTFYARHTTKTCARWLNGDFVSLSSSLKLRRIRVHDSLKFSLPIVRAKFFSVTDNNSTSFSSRMLNFIIQRKSTDSKSFRFATLFLLLIDLSRFFRAQKHFYFALAISTNIFLFFFLPLHVSLSLSLGTM